LEFNQNRLEVKSLTAMTGGGPASVSGYLAYQHGIFADLSFPAGIRIVSARRELLADAICNFRLAKTTFSFSAM